MNRIALGLPVALVLGLSAAGDADAARRGIRVDGFGDAWTLDENFGTANCPGASAASLSMTRFGITFTGHNNAIYLTDTYCQVTRAGFFTGASIFQPDEAGLASLIGANPGNAITGARYSYIDRPLFSGDEAGFQWAFYHFPNGVVIVALYGLQGLTLTNATSIKLGATTLWQAGSDGFDGEYFCFRNGTYLGEWSGATNDGSTCMAQFTTLFRNGFE